MTPTPGGWGPRTRGAAAIVPELGPDVVRAGVEACNHEACIAAVYNGSVERHQQIIDDTGTDHCAGYVEPTCTPDRVRRALTQVLRFVSIPGRCQSTDVHASDRGPQILVSCEYLGPGASESVRVTDRVPLRPTAAGGVLVEGMEAFPGYLPRIYDLLEGEGLAPATGQ